MTEVLQTRMKNIYAVQRVLLFLLHLHSCIVGLIYQLFSNGILMFIRSRFFEAVKAGDVEKFSWHLDNGCPVDFLEDGTADTPLLAACRFGQGEIVSLALARGAKNDPHPSFGQTALQTAVSAGHVNCVQMILETAAPSGSDAIIVNHEDPNGEAPIHVASRCGCLSVLELLVTHGANVSLVDHRGWTALHCAAGGGHDECLGYLLGAAGGDALVEQQDDRGDTSLHVAVRANRLKCAQVLLETAADASATTLEGMTPYQIAKKQKLREMAKILLGYDTMASSSTASSEDSVHQSRGSLHFDFINDTTAKSSALLPRPHGGSSTRCPGLSSSPSRKNSNKNMFRGLDLFTISCGSTIKKESVASNTADDVSVVSDITGTTHTGASSCGAYHTDGMILDGVGRRRMSYSARDAARLIQQDFVNGINEMPTPPPQLVAAPTSTFNYGGGHHFGTNYMSAYHRMHQQQPLSSTQHYIAPGGVAMHSLSYAGLGPGSSSASMYNDGSSSLNGGGGLGSVDQIRSRAYIGNNNGGSAMNGHECNNSTASVPMVGTTVPCSIGVDSHSQQSFFHNGDTWNIYFKDEKPYFYRPRDGMCTVRVYVFAIHLLVRDSSLLKFFYKLFFRCALSRRLLWHQWDDPRTQSHNASTHQHHQGTVGASKSIKPGVPSPQTCLDDRHNMGRKNATDERTDINPQNDTPSVVLKDGDQEGLVNVATERLSSITSTEKDCTHSPTPSTSREDLKSSKTCASGQEKRRRLAPPPAVAALMAKKAALGLQSVTRLKSTSDNGRSSNLSAEESDKSRLAQHVTQSSECDPRIAKYSKMLSMGVPSAAVENKMRQDGMGDHDMKIVLSVLNARSKHNDEGEQEKRSKSDKDPIEESLSRYSKMISVGVPLDPVLHKMKQDGIDPNKIETFRNKHSRGKSAVGSNGRIHADVSSENPINGRPNTSHKEQEHKPTKDELAKNPALTKYMKMAGVGVPPLSVVQKMEMEGVPKEDIKMFKQVHGLIPSTKDEGGGKTQNSSNRAPLPPLPPEPPPTRRTSVTMQKIHWRPVAEEKARNSLWASGNEEENELDQTEIQQLESLFGAKPSMSKKIPNKVSRTSTRAQKQEVKLIDLKRANNIAISLAQFRSFPNYDELCEAVIAQDTVHLNAEKLQNLQLLLPTVEEITTIKQHTAGGSGQGLGRAETFFLSVSKVPRFAQKLEAFLFTLQFEEIVDGLKQSLDLLEKASNEVVRSKKLAGVLRKLLAVGNLMNEGAGKPKVVGITLDSLLKTANKKGSDGKTTVIDHVVATLVMRQDNSEPPFTTTASSSSVEGNNKNNNNVAGLGTAIDFWLEMPSVQEATRIDIRDCHASFREIQTGFRRIEAAIDVERNMVESGSKCRNVEHFLERSKAFLEQARAIRSNIETKLQHVESRVEALCCFFAEDANTCQVRSKRAMSIVTQVGSSLLLCIF
mmetsp:Transcript_53338/g.79704  ORF Transcript_53338/g.79704 Transcript_53338/m.79704 type:complete len:1448 (-) Transcript_53338:1919-6262(-)